MNGLDIILMVLAAFFIFWGVFTGFINQLFWLLSLILGSIGGVFLYPYTAKVFSWISKNQDIPHLIGFIITFIAIALLTKWLGRLVRKPFRLPVLGAFDHILGGLFGVISALFVATFGIMALTSFLPARSSFLKGSKLTPHVQKIANKVIGMVPKRLRQKFEKRLHKLKATGKRALERIKKDSKAVPLREKKKKQLKAIKKPHASRGAAPDRNRRYAGGALMDIEDLAPNVVVDMRYATSKNFLHRKLYSKNKCLLRPRVAKMVAKAQKYLERQGKGLKVWDCYRPRSVQWKMWKVFPKPGFVANPRAGSNHNRGAAVDVTLVDRRGRELEMPTPFDEFSRRARHGYRGGSLKSRINRETLKRAMNRAGFQSIISEWWHYNAPGVKKYALLNIPFSRL